MSQGGRWPWVCCFLVITLIMEQIIHTYGCFWKLRHPKAIHNHWFPKAGFLRILQVFFHWFEDMVFGVRIHSISLGLGQHQVCPASQLFPGYAVTGHIIIHIYIYICMCIYIYICMCICIYTHVYIYIYIYVYIYTYIYIYTNTYVMYLCMYVCVCMHVCMYVILCNVMLCYVLYCIVLYCIVLYCIVLYSIVLYLYLYLYLYCIVLYCMYV